MIAVLHFVLQVDGLLTLDIFLLCLLGVGKSSLINQFCHKNFTHEYHVTIGVEFGSKEFTMPDGTQITLQIWDAVHFSLIPSLNPLCFTPQAGQEAFRSLIRSFYRNAAAVVLVYSVC